MNMTNIENIATRCSFPTSPSDILVRDIAADKRGGKG